MSPRPRAKLKAHPGLLWRTWGDESVVFHPESGQTHLLDLVSREGLARLQDTALDPEELCGKMAERLDVANDNELLLYVERLVSRFEELGLVIKETTDS